MRRVVGFNMCIALVGAILYPSAALAQPVGVPRAAESPADLVAPQDVSMAGAATVDASWHLGASGGQFSSGEPPVSEEMVDPYAHSTKKRPSYGLGSRSTVRAIVVQDPEGERVAIVSHDLYLPQDLLTRRIATLVQRNTGIPADHIFVTASHNHNSAYYSTPGWGTWLFQDVYDLRFYEYMAERAARAVTEANDSLVPVRMGGTTTRFTDLTSHTYGPKVADDGTPAGQPYNHTTNELSVVAFDDVSNPSNPKPLATWVVFGVHPEWTWGYDLINGDIGHATSRIVDREVGGITVWSGREIGTSGPHKDTRAHEPEERQEYQDNGFAQMDRAARKLASAVQETRAEIIAGTPDDPERFAAPRTSFDVGAVSRRFAPPTTRPYPGVSNCNTYTFFHGDPGVPILGLPDCEKIPTGPVGDAIGPIGGRIYEQLKEAGVPVPESYSATALTAVEETAAVHLMAVKLGSIGITVCPCEQFTDTALNIESRIDRAGGNLWTGWNWADQQTPAGRDWCIQNPDTTWTCADPRAPRNDLAPVDDLAYRRMIAQIENDAAGWEDDLATLGSEAEPNDPARIKGNFTHEEFPEQGFDLPIAVGMANDYWGYVPEYREYRSHDHYRKALSGLGPHGADFLATRLARLAVSLNGGPGPDLRPIDTIYQAESARAQAVADGLGELADAYEQAYAATLPPDGGEPAIEPAGQPNDTTLFDASKVTWTGGSTYSDIPEVIVQRLVDGRWVDYADTQGEAQVMVAFPAPQQLPEWRAGDFAWRWTATFEAFGSDISLPDMQGTRRTSTPFGTYRFVISGEHRRESPATTRPYELLSDPFEVTPWAGIAIEDFRRESDGTLSFVVGPTTTRIYDSGKVEVLGPIDLPDTYPSPFRYIDGTRKVFTYGLGDPSRHQVYCSFCSFRPWADVSEVTAATITIIRPNDRPELFPAYFDPVSGRWRTQRELRPNETAFVDVGGVTDTFGNINGAPSPTITR